MRRAGDPLAAVTRTRAKSERSQLRRQGRAPPREPWAALKRKPPDSDGGEASRPRRFESPLSAKKIEPTSQRAREPTKKPKKRRGFEGWGPAGGGYENASEERAFAVAPPREGPAPGFEDTDAGRDANAWSIEAQQPFEEGLGQRRSSEGHPHWTRPGGLLQRASFP